MIFTRIVQSRDAELRGTRYLCCISMINHLKEYLNTNTWELLLSANLSWRTHINRIIIITKTRKIIIVQLAMGCCSDNFSNGHEV